VIGKGQTGRCARGFSEELYGGDFLGIRLSDLKTDTGESGGKQRRRWPASLYPAFQKKIADLRSRLAAQAQAQPADEAGIKKTLQEIQDAEELLLSFRIFTKKNLKYWRPVSVNGRPDGIGIKREGIIQAHRQRRQTPLPMLWHLKRHGKERQEKARLTRSFSGCRKTWPLKNSNEVRFGRGDGPGGKCFMSATAKLRDEAQVKLNAQNEAGVPKKVRTSGKSLRRIKSVKIAYWTERNRDKKAGRSSDFLRDACSFWAFNLTWASSRNLAVRRHKNTSRRDRRRGRNDFVDFSAARSCGIRRRTS